MFDKLKLFEYYLAKPGYVTGFQRNDHLGYTAIALMHLKGEKYELVDTLFLLHGNAHPWKWNKLRVVE